MVVHMKTSLSCIYVQYRVKIKVQCFAGGELSGSRKFFCFNHPNPLKSRFERPLTLLKKMCKNVKTKKWESNVRNSHVIRIPYCSVCKCVSSCWLTEIFEFTHFIHDYVLSSLTYIIRVKFNAHFIYCTESCSNCYNKLCATGKRGLANNLSNDIACAWIGPSGPRNPIL